MWNDPKIRLKREFLDQQASPQRTGSKVLTGDEWYSQQASRAVNQAVGRVIRHRDDHGAIIFCDERFARSNHQSQISRWIQPHIQCYSKFGDVVFTLTRFFRDASNFSSTKPKLVKIEESDKNNCDKFQSLDKLHLDKLLTPLTAETDKSCCVESSSIAEVKQGNISCRLGEILPANRSNLTFDKHYPNSNLKRLGNRLSEEKLKNDMQFRQNKVIDLTEDEETSKQLTAPRFIKKPKLGNPQHNLLRQCESSCEGSVKSNLQSSQSGDREVQECSTTKRTSEFVSSETRTATVSCSPSDQDERKGSTFLIQVREKLSDREYKEFVGLMKALKSKAMKIGHVLQSIMTLFSSPDRHPLLQRFKDYIPGKYHSLYDKFLERRNEA